ncbi:MAG: antitoxin VapB family protein [Candidatus Hermodarchaeota archaeon]
MLKIEKKVISITKVAYQALLSQKRKNETISDVVLRLASQQSKEKIREFAGKLGELGVDEEEIEQFKKQAREMWKEED